MDCLLKMDLMLLSMKRIKHFYRFVHTAAGTILSSSETGVMLSAILFIIGVLLFVPLMKAAKREKASIFYEKKYTTSINAPNKAFSERHLEIAKNGPFFLQKDGI